MIITSRHAIPGEPAGRRFGLPRTTLALLRHQARHRQLDFWRHEYRRRLTVGGLGWSVLLGDRDTGPRVGRD